MNASSKSQPFECHSTIDFETKPSPSQHIQNARKRLCCWLLRHKAVSGSGAVVILPD